MPSPPPYQTVRCINKLVASMSSLGHWFVAIAGSIGEKNKNGYYKAPLPLTDTLVKYVFVLRKTCPSYWWKKVLQAYCHFLRERALSVTHHSIRKRDKRGKSRNVSFLIPLSYISLSPFFVGNRKQNTFFNTYSSLYVLGLKFFLLSVKLFFFLVLRFDLLCSILMQNNLICNRLFLYRYIN